MDRWALVVAPGLSTRFLSVQMSATPSGLFQPVPPLVRLEVREGKNVISRAVSASYGFQEATGFVQLALADSGEVKPSTVTLMIDPEPKGKSVEIVLFDAATDWKLTRLSSFPVSMVGF